MNSSDLNDPPTAVGGIQTHQKALHRKDLNNPPTAVGGILSIESLQTIDVAHPVSREAHSVFETVGVSVVQVANGF